MRALSLVCKQWFDTLCSKGAETHWEMICFRKWSNELIDLQAYSDYDIDSRWRHLYWDNNCRMCSFKFFRNDLIEREKIASFGGEPEYSRLSLGAYGYLELQKGDRNDWTVLFKPNIEDVTIMINSSMYSSNKHVTFPFTVTICRRNGFLVNCPYYDVLSKMRVTPLPKKELPKLKNLLCESLTAEEAEKMILKLQEYGLLEIISSTTFKWIGGRDNIRKLYFANRLPGPKPLGKCKFISW